MIVHSNIFRFISRRSAWIISIGLAVFLNGLLTPGVVHGQLHPRFSIHELQPGMLAREVLLHAHAPVDTTLWGGAGGASILSFRGMYFSDSGEFRVATDGPEITQITFNSKPRTAEQNQVAWKRVLQNVESLHGRATEEYNNTYHIVTWEGTNEVLKFTTSDNGKYYSVALSRPAAVHSLPRRDIRSVVKSAPADH